ncbi:hypothetical protein RRG08_000056 [Elysia crispata]|uniref:Uncharacterized protein n=1 Tax=Elysia crispata TaxID=231223 RepID=A0AAE0Z8M1_9GAST|nr:hypothetical protein RRG08_000056 [Elysia crispata]
MVTVNERGALTGQEVPFCAGPLLRMCMEDYARGSTLLPLPPPPPLPPPLNSPRLHEGWGLEWKLLLDTTGKSRLPCWVWGGRREESIPNLDRGGPHHWRLKSIGGDRIPEACLSSWFLKLLTQYYGRNWLDHGSLPCLTSSSSDYVKKNKASSEIRLSSSRSNISKSMF